MAKPTKYTWVQTHKELVNYLKGKKDDQLGLIELLKDSGCEYFNDKDSDGNTIPLEVIDPFTFFCYINKYAVQRLGILQRIAEKIKIHVPTDDYGLPSANPQKVWLFPYKGARNNNEIERLWSFFYAVTEDKITDALFADILNISGVGMTKLTEVLFYCDPVAYFPINGPTRPYLQDVWNINPNFKTNSEYLEILKQIKSHTNKPFYELSHEAWEWNQRPEITESTNISTSMKFPLNQIFYGPPGTGKTYHTINEAIKIVDRDFYTKNKESREELTKKYRELLITDWKDTKGQIAFCTFHQSFSYEDFVEGIKPQTNDEKNVYYEVLPGIFKQICELADSSQSSNKLKKQGKISWSKEEFRKAFFYKLSLGEANNPDDREIYEYCIKNNYHCYWFR